MSKDIESIEEYKEYIQMLLNHVLRDVLKNVRLQDTISTEDLLHEGVTGLIEARRRYDPDRGVKFTTFASYRVKGAIIDALRKMQPYDRYTYLKMRQARESNRVEDARLESVNALEPSRLNELLGRIAPELIAAELCAADELRSVYCPEGIYLEDEAKREVSRLVAELPSRERILVRDVYFRERSLSETAASLGLSASWASRLLQRALDRMRAEIEREDGDEAHTEPDELLGAEGEEARGEEQDQRRRAHG